MRQKHADDLTKNQRKAWEFFVARFRSGEPFDKRDLKPLTTWSSATLRTYWQKQFRPFVVPAGSGKLRVSDAFRPLARWKDFRRYVTQVRRVSSQYARSVYSHVLVFEFFMPLTNEAHLRWTLDSLFYKETISARLKGLDKTRLEQHFERLKDESEHDYLARLCGWLAGKFVGYSISTVNGRFRAHDLLTRMGSAEIEAGGDRYLIDETTAIVRFIFPCGPAINGAPLQDEFDEAEPTDDRKGREEAGKIRWFFYALFVESIMETINEQDEIWLVESGFRDRLHVWKVAEN